MQIIHSKGLPAQAGNIVEKVLRDKEGRLVRARFYVYENAGRMKARLVDFSIIETLKGVVATLAGFVKEKISQPVLFFKKTSETLGLINQSLYFTGSKPRAPTF